MPGEETLSPRKWDCPLPVSVGDRKTVSPEQPTDPQPSAEPTVGGGITIAEFQQLIRRMYLPKDIARGTAGTFMWLVEEIGELSSALRDGTHEERVLEFADVLAWLATIANVVDVDLTEAVRQKYGSGCPGCGRFICTCPDAEKP